MDEAITNGVDFDEEFQALTANNNKKWLRVAGYPEMEAGKCIRFLGIIHDITEYKQIQSEADAHASKWQTTFDAITDSVSIINLDGEVIQYNEATKLLLINNEESVQCKHCYQLVHGTNEHYPNCPLVRMKESKKSEAMEFKEGETWYKVTVDPIFNADHELEGAVHIVSDITNSKNAHEQLEESENRFRSAITNAPYPLMIHAEGKVLQLSNEWIKTTAYSIKDIPTIKEWTRKAYGEDAVPSQDFIDKLYELKTVQYDGEWEINTKNGEKRIWDFSSSPIGNLPDGKKMVISMAIDITERKKTEKDLHESQEIFKNFMEHSPIYVFFKDENIRPIRLSKNYETMLNMPVEDILGKNMNELFPSDLAKKMVSDDIKILKENKEVRVEEELNGRYYTTIKFPIHIEGKPPYLAGYTIDITEQKLGELELKKTNDFVESIIEQSPSPIWISDEKGTLISINPACKKMLNITDEEVIGKYNVFEDNIVIEQGYLPLVKDVFKTGKTAKFELKYDTSQLQHLQLKGMANVILDVTMFPIKDTKGNITNAVIQHFDITERKLAEEKLKQSEQRLKTILDSSPFPTAVVDVNDDNIKYWSISAKQLFGHDPKTTQEWYELAYPDPDYRNDVVQRGKPFLEIAEKSSEALNTGEYSIVCKDGSTKICEIYAQFIPGNLIVTLNDITERKQTEILLRNEKERIRTILDLVGDPIFVKDNEHRITLANRAFYTMFKMNEKDVKGYTLVEAVPENERHHFLKVDREVLDTGIPDKREEALTVEGVTKTIITRKIRYIDELGDKFLVGSIHDITERKQAEEEINKLTLLLKETGKMAKIGGWDLNPQTGKGTWTEEVARIHELDPDEPSNMEKGLSFYTPESREKIEKAIKEAIDNYTSYDLELEMITAKGKRKWIRTIGQPTKKGAIVTRIHGSFQDITERKQFLEKLEELVAERTRDLEEKNKELDRSLKVFVGRELTIKKLQNKIQELEGNKH